MASPYHMNSSHGFHEIHNLGRPFLGHHYYKINAYFVLSTTQCIQEEKKHCIFTICPCPALEPLSGGHEICNFGRPFLGHHYYVIDLFESCARLEIFKE